MKKSLVCSILIFSLVNLTIEASYSPLWKLLPSLFLIKIFQQEFMHIGLTCLRLKYLPECKATEERKQCFKKMKKLFKLGVNPNTKIRYAGDPILIEAIRSTDLQTVELLLEYGANPNSRDSYATPALVVAASIGEVAIVKLLLQYGANPLLQQLYLTKTDIHLKTHTYNINAWRENPKNTALGAALETAANCHHSTVIELLLGHMLDTNHDKIDEDGNTLLHLAAQYNYPELVKKCLEEAT